MVRRNKKRMRQKTKFQKIFREKAGSKNRDEESNAFDPQRSPEMVLCESPHADLLCNEKLSPEIISKRSKIRLRAKVCKAEVEDEVAARSKIELSHPCSLKRHEHDAKSTSDLPHLEDYPKRDTGGSIVGETLDSNDCYSFRSLFLKKRRSSDANKCADDTPNQNISQLATFCSNLKSRLRDNVYIFMGDVPEHANADEKSGERSPEERSQQEDRCKPETINDCYPLNKTFSINDDFICQMENYLENQPSAIVAGHFTVKKSSSIADLQSESFDKFRFAKSSVRESVDGNDGSRDEADESRKRRSANKRFGAGALGKRLITNMHRKIFSHLKRIIKKIRGQNKERGASFLAKYKKFIDDRWHSYTSTTLSSLSVSTPSSSPSDANGCGNPITNRSLLAEEARESEESDQETGKIDFAIQSGFTTPCSGSSPSAKRCRTTLKFEDEDEKVGEPRRPATRAEITDPFLRKGRKSEKRSFPLNLSLCEETPHWNSCILESTFFLSDDDPSVAPDYDSNENSSQQERFEDDAYKHRMSRSTATTRNSRHRSRRSVPRAIIIWLIALCVWLKKKLLHLLNSAYKKVQTINSFLTKKSSLTKDVSEEERIDYLITTLRFENEKMLCALSEKMTRLSADLVQMRTDIETSLDVLTIEMNVVREANKKMTENNATIMQELKKLHEILEEVQSKSAQSFPFFSSSCPSSSPSRSPPPPPPPPPLPPALLSSSFLPFSPKTQSSKLTAPKIPPPPPLPLFSAPVQPSKPLIQPTTPSSSSKSNKNGTPTRKSFTPSFNRPSITVEDLLKVTLRKAPQSAKDNARRSGPGVSQEMLRNVQLKSTKRRLPTGDQIGRSPRSGRIIKSRIASNINLSPILTGSENDLETILRQVKLTRPRRLLTGSSSFDHDFMRETQSRETPTHSQSQSGFDRF